MPVIIPSPFMIMPTPPVVVAVIMAWLAVIDARRRSVIMYWCRLVVNHGWRRVVIDDSRRRGIIARDANIHTQAERIPRISAARSTHR